MPSRYAHRLATRIRVRAVVCIDEVALKLNFYFLRFALLHFFVRDVTHFFVHFSEELLELVRCVALRCV